MDITSSCILKYPSFCVCALSLQYIADMPRFYVPFCFSNALIISNARITLYAACNDRFLASFVFFS